MKENITDYVHQSLDYAKKAGANAADAIYVSDTDVTVGWRNGAQEKLERSESSGLGLRVWVGDKIASVSTGDMQPESLQLLAERAVAMAKVASNDPHNSLADKSLWVSNFIDLQLADDYAPDAPELQQAAHAMEESALQQRGITNSEGAEASYSRSHFVLGTSHGFLGESIDTSFAFSVSVLAGEGDEMERDYDYGVARFWQDLPDPASLGISAAEKTLKRLNPRKKETCQVPVIFDPRVGRSLLSSFAGAINGASIVRGTSFLKEAMGQPLFHETVTIIDDPLRVRGLASQTFDAEGVACHPLTLVENGVLRSWLLDLRSASKLGLTTTGHAARGLGSNPSPSSSNFYMAAGQGTPQQMIADIKEGFYVTETFGMGVNLITGDYSQGASGFWIEDGEICYPVAELTIAGKLRDMFASLIPANDLVFRYGKNAPTFRIDGMTVAGN